MIRSSKVTLISPALFFVEGRCQLSFFQEDVETKAAKMCLNLEAKARERDLIL